MLFALLGSIMRSTQSPRASASRGVKFHGSLNYSWFGKTRSSNSGDSRSAQIEPSFFWHRMGVCLEKSISDANVESSLLNLCRSCELVIAAASLMSSNSDLCDHWCRWILRSKTMESLVTQVTFSGFFNAGKSLGSLLILGLCAWLTLRWMASRVEVLSESLGLKPLVTEFAITTAKVILYIVVIVSALSSLGI